MPLTESGTQWESRTVRMLKSIGVPVVTYKEYTTAPFLGRNKRIVAITNHPYKSPFRQQGKHRVGIADVMLVDNRTGEKFRVECKTQRTSGTVDEKFLGLVSAASLRNRGYDKLFLVIQGSTPRALEHVKDAIARGAHIELFTSLTDLKNRLMAWLTLAHQLR